MVPESGVRMVIECRVPSSDTPDVFDIYNDDGFYTYYGWKVHYTLSN